MYKAEFDKQLEQNSSYQNFIFFGESSFFIDYYTQKLSNIEGSNKLLLYFDEYNFNHAKEHIAQASLFGGTNLLVLKAEKKIPKKELESLFELCNKGDNRVIYSYYGSDHKSYNNSFKKFNAATVRFFHPKQNEAMAMLQLKAKRLELNIDHYTLNHLYHLQNLDLELSLNELDKLSILGNERLSNKEIDSLVFGLKGVDTQTLFKNILYKKEYLEDLNILLESKEDEVRLLSSLCAFFQELYMFNIYIRVHGVANAKAILGYSPPNFVVQEKAAMAMKIKPQQYYYILQHLLQAEHQLKSSAGDKLSILYGTLLGLEKFL